MPDRLMYWQHSQMWHLGLLGEKIVRYNEAIQCGTMANKEISVACEAENLIP